MELVMACRTGDYSRLSPPAREVCIRMFRNQRWEIPMGLTGEVQVCVQGKVRPKEELTLWRAVELFLDYPEIKTSRERPRYKQCLFHLLKYFGEDKPVKDIWVPEIKEYMSHRLAEGVSPSTVNRQKGTLSKVFQVLEELRFVDQNPVRLVRNVSQKVEERQVYISHSDIQRVLELVPGWFRPIVWTAYCSGMRQGEVLGLTRRQISLAKRIIYLGPQDTKEMDWKKVPVHKALVPTLEEAMKVRQLATDRVFLLNGRSPSRHSLTHAWIKAVNSLGITPRPRFHDLRHTWRANARRSGMDPSIAESIMGHWQRGKSMRERYGRVSDEELLHSIDALSFDHGVTEVWVARK